MDVARVTVLAAALGVGLVLACERSPSAPGSPVPAASPSPQQSPASAAVSTPPGSPAITPPATSSELSEVAAAKADAARRTGIAAGNWRTVEVTDVTWPDPGLGCPEPGAVYPQVLTPGLRIRLESGSRRLEYHAGAGRVVYCSG